MKYFPLLSHLHNNIPTLIIKTAVISYSFQPGLFLLHIQLFFHLAAVKALQSITLLPWLEWMLRSTLKNRCKYIKKAFLRGSAIKGNMKRWGDDCTLSSSWDYWAGRFWQSALIRLTVTAVFTTEQADKSGLKGLWWKWEGWRGDAVWASCAGALKSKGWTK